MRILDRYIGREVFSYALLGLIVFTFVFFIPQLVRLMELVVRYGADAPTMALLFLCTLPGVLTFTLPMAVLVGVLIGLGRMSADSELVALHALGIGLRRLLVPVGVLAAACLLLTLAMTFWLGPRAAATFRAVEQRLMAAPAAVQVQPRVFDERFGRWVLYIQDVAAAGTHWRGIFLARSEAEDGSEITLAEEARLITDRAEGRFQLHLRNGSRHVYSLEEPGRYGISTFGESDVSVSVTGRVTARPRPPALAELPARELLARAAKGQDEAWIELHRRLAFPAACLVFALLGVPVGVHPGRGSRAFGMVLALLLVSGYYLLFVYGIGLARRGVVPPWLGAWVANLLVMAAGLALLPGMERIGERGWVERLRDALAAWRGGSRRRAAPAAAPGANGPAPAAIRVWPRLGGFPLLLDLYLLRSFVFYFLLLLAGFLLLFDAFTFFELLEDIGRNRVPFGVVGPYFFFLTPHMVYQLAPLAALLAALVTLALMTRHNEITAFKASGISLYRLSLPLFVAGGLLAGGLFLLDDTVLPYTNQTQDALRNQIKGRPAQTFHQPRRQWIFGQGGKLYNYDLFDPDRELFGGLSVFQLDPQTFQIERRVYARRAQWRRQLGGWVLEEGWVRDFDGPRVTSYVPFLVDTLGELTEPPAYFRREVRQHYQMNAGELRDYIRELQQAGFDAARLSVQWHRKFAFPLMAPILVLLAVPFALKVGNRGAVGGLAAGIGIAIVFWAVSALFEAMGAVGQLPVLLAGWAPAAVFTFTGLYFYLKTPT